MSRTTAATIVMLAAAALAFRLLRLADRPMHSDEANQAVKTGILLETGRYRYDPEDHHGPTLYYLSLPAAWAAGGTLADVDEADLRFVTVAFGVGIALLPLLLMDGLGRWAALCAGLLLAVSPAMVYYSRFYVHEALLAFFTLAAVAAGWRWMRTGRAAWAVAAGACIGLMQATKETSVIAYAAAAGAVWLTFLSLRGAAAEREHRLPIRHLAWGAAAGLVVWAVWMSSFGTNLRGPVDAVLAYAGYVKRAGGAGLHENPWHFYIHRLTWWRPAGGPVWTELPIVLLAATGAVTAFVPWRARAGDVPLVRFFAFYTAIMLLAYSLIPYKTPWCLMSPLTGMCVLGGAGIVAVGRLVGGRTGRGVAVAVALAAVLVLAGQMCRANYRLHSHPTNPYAYAQTSPDLLGLVKLVGRVAAAHPSGDDMLVRVVAPPHGTWPLPWYFRSLRRVGYWTQVGDVPVPADAPVLVTVPEFQERLGGVLGDGYRIAYYGLRNEVIVALYVRADLWHAVHGSGEGSRP